MDLGRPRQHLPHPLPRVLEAITEAGKPDLDSDIGREEMDDDGYRPLSTARENSKCSTMTKYRTILVDSEASVYTKNSKLSELSTDVHQQLPPSASSSLPSTP